LALRFLTPFPFSRLGFKVPDTFSFFDTFSFLVIDAKGITHSWTDVALGWISLSSQHWQFTEITECALVPRESLKRHFAVLVVRTTSTADVIAVPWHVDLQRIQHLLRLQGVRVVVQQRLPEELLPDPSLLSPRNRARFGLAAVSLALFVLGVVNK
jgi:hypothetical protein